MESSSIKKTIVWATASFFSSILIAVALKKFVETFFYVCFLAPTLTLVLFLCVPKLLRFKKYSKAKSFGIPNHFYVLNNIIGSLLAFSFLATVPLNIDRSFSVWMLKSMYTSDNTLSVLELELVASKYFSPSEGEIRRRILEQQELGNMTMLDDNTIKLTKKGKVTVRFHSKIAKFFSLNEKYSKID